MFEEQQDVREVVTFYMRPVQDKEATKEAGRPIHVDAEYVRISIPGDRTLEVDRPVREPDRQMYRRKYEAFSANKSQDEVSGTLLSAWGAISQSTVEDYRYAKVRTVEQLANLSDSTVAKLGRGVLNHRQMARDFIEAAKSNAPMLKLQSELASRDEQLAAQQAQMAAMQAALKEQGDMLEELTSGKTAQPKKAK